MDNVGVWNTLAPQQTIDVRTTPAVQATTQPTAAPAGLTATLPPEQPQGSFLARHARDVQTAAGLISSLATLAGAFGEHRDLKERASQEKDLARERSEVRNTELRRAQGATRAQAAASGITAEGSPEQILESNQQAFDRESKSDARFTRQSVSNLKRSSRAALAAGLINAGGGVFQTFQTRREIGRV